MKVKIYNDILNPTIWENGKLKPEIKEKLLQIEPLFISYFDTICNGYNISLGGVGNVGHCVSNQQIEKQNLLLLNLFQIFYMMALFQIYFH